MSCLDLFSLHSDKVYAAHALADNICRPNDAQTLTRSVFLGLLLNYNTRAYLDHRLRTLMMVRQCVHTNSNILFLHGG